MMSTTAQRQDSDLTPPRAGTTPGLHVTCLSTSTTEVTYDLVTFTQMFGRYLDFTAEGGVIYLAFTPTDTGDIDGSASNAAIAAGTTAATPWLLRDGETRPYRLDATADRFLHVRAASGTPKLRFCASSPVAV